MRVLTVGLDVPLGPLTTLGVGGRARRFTRVTTDQEMTDAIDERERMLVIGGGSNLVIGDAGFDGLVVQMATSGMTIRRDGDFAYVIARAGVPWDDFVGEMVDARLAGVECLSGIPGLVGATPMQNVGAYGQEVSDTVDEVRVYDQELGKDMRINADDCGFGYRRSMFRGSSRWIVLDVLFILRWGEPSMPVRYLELARALGVPEGGRAPLRTVRDTVIALRRAKGMVIDPADPESRSAGSFFTNPIVSEDVLARLDERFGDAMPRWTTDDGIKLSAGWLIEHAGFAKGYTIGNVGISRKHALALVNRGDASTAELLRLAHTIQTSVKTEFGVALEIEPVIVDG